MVGDQRSEITIYRGAVEKALSSQRFSSSDEELRISDEFNTSDEDRFNNNLVNASRVNRSDAFFPEGHRPNESMEVREAPQSTKQVQQPLGEQPKQDDAAYANERAQQAKAQERATKLIQDAEEAKARIYEVAGKIERQNKLLSKELMLNEQARALIIDENYKMIASHVDDSTRQKIVNNEYVDFAKLIPRDRVLQEEDGRMIWVQKAGETFLIPASDKDRDSSGITNFFKWEQAFRVFSDIYLEQYPNKVGELLQYCHEIQATSLHYAWDNVYRYDREFRVHISKNPDRTWAVTLQKAWNMFIKDRTNRSGNFNHYQNKRDGQNNANNVAVPGKKKVCFGFNTARCTYGNRCRYDHRCAFCGKFGHGSQVCRKAVGVTDRATSGPTASTSRSVQETDQGNDRFFKVDKKST